MEPEQRIQYRQLVANGRWPEAAAWREARRQELRQQGVARQAATKQSWDEMIARYLPPDTGDGAPGDSGDEPQRAAEPSRSTARVEVSGDTEPEEVEAVESPEAVEPPEPVGSGADWIRDVSWVYQQYSRVVVLEPGKPPRCHFARATTPVPSGGARGLMEWAATNRTAFYNLAGKYLSQEGTEDEDARVKRDELKADKVREVLKRFLEVKAERAKDEWI